MIDIVIDRILSIEFKDQLDSIDFNSYSFPLLAIGCFTKTNFKLVDSRFHEFGKIYHEAIMKYEEYATKFEMDLIFDSFSELILNNISYSNFEIFPNHDIQNVREKLQIFLLLKNMYFNLLPNVLNKCADIQFKFK